MRRRSALLAAAGIAAGAVVAAGVAALAVAGGPAGRGLVARADRRRNAVTGDGVAGDGVAVSERARELHATLRVVDLHADSLFWGRDLLVRSSVGHVDVPRLIEGNIALQGFAIATRVPRNVSMERNEVDAFDDVTLIALGLGWPRPAMRDPLARALHLAERAAALAAASEGRLAIIRSRSDLRDHLARREADPRLTACFLALEGAHPLTGDPSQIEGLVDRLVEAGYRMMGPSHFLDTEFAGSAHGAAKGGLTALGRELVALLEARSVIVDLAHASPAAIDDVIADARRPVVVSHAGVRATCDSVRNLTDEELRAVAGTGGLVGIGFWPGAVCGEDPASIARAIEHAVSVVGVRHVALGSDFDGAVSAPFDAAGLARLTEALLEAGFAETAIQAVMGENALRLLDESLPTGA
ncbi:MAG: dipeptidase [Candidatus Limnocylindrales bacterium]